jgi:hypothetical protein
MTRASICVVLLCFFGCVHPQPIPSPVPVADAAPAIDRFTGKVFDCHLDVVAIERDSAKPDVDRCLAAGTPTTCPVDLGQYSDATVACLARDLGAAANARVLKGSTDPSDTAKASGARSWINSERLGYK